VNLGPTPASVDLPAFHYLLDVMHMCPRLCYGNSDLRPMQSPSRRSINEQVSIVRLRPRPCLLSCPPTSLLLRPPFLARFRCLDPVARNACVLISPSQLTETYRWTTLLHCMCTDGPTGGAGRVGTRRCHRRLRPASSSLTSLKTSAAVCKGRRAKRARGIDDGGVKQ
jgi:hypothetical protein